MDFTKLKNRKKDTDKLKEMVNKSSNNQYNDDRVWSCELDAAGNGHAIIRFLPASSTDCDYFINEMGYSEESLPFWVSNYYHSFKSKSGRWYIENCPTSIKGKCPVCDFNGSEIEEAGGWDSLEDRHPVKVSVRERKRKQRYRTNILIINDPNNPDNNGEVRIFEFGPSIFKKIKNAMFPEFDDDESVDPSDLWTGCNFKLRITRENNYANYDKSSFDSISPISEDDNYISDIWSKTHNLTDFIKDDQYKSYDDLNENLENVLNKPTQKKASINSDDESASTTNENTLQQTSNTNYTSSEINDDNQLIDDDSDAIEMFQNMLDS